MTLSKLVARSKKILVSIIFILLCCFVLVQVAPELPNWYENWSSYSLNINVVKWLILFVCFVFWSDIGRFFIKDESRLNQFISVRFNFLLVVLLIETTTWITRSI